HAARRRRHARNGQDGSAPGSRDTHARAGRYRAHIPARARTTRSDFPYSVAANRHAPPPPHTGGRPVARGSCNQLDIEALAAAALVLDVRVLELESLVQALAGVVELGAVDIRQTLRIHDDAHPVDPKSLPYV